MGRLTISFSRVNSLGFFHVLPGLPVGRNDYCSQRNMTLVMGASCLTACEIPCDDIFMKCLSYWYVRKHVLLQ